MATSWKISSQVTGLIQGLAASVLEVALTEKRHLAQWQIPLGDGSHMHFQGYLCTRETMSVRWSRYVCTCLHTSAGNRLQREELD